MVYWIIFACMMLVCAVLYPMLRKSPPPRHSAISLGAPSHPRVHEPSLSCTCEEWRNQRARFRQGDPRRLCVHLCQYLARDTASIPDALTPFAQSICLMGEEGKGVPYHSPAFAFVLGDSGYISTIEENAYPWATVYIGRTVYTFNIQDGRWGDAGTPPFAADIGNLIQAETRRRLARLKNPTPPPPPPAPVLPQ